MLMSSIQHSQNSTETGYIQYIIPLANDLISGLIAIVFTLPNARGIHSVQQQKIVECIEEFFMHYVMRDHKQLLQYFRKTENVFVFKMLKRRPPECQAFKAGASCLIKSRLT